MTKGHWIHSKNDCSDRKLVYYLLAVCKELMLYFLVFKVAMHCAKLVIVTCCLCGSRSEQVQACFHLTLGINMSLTHEMFQTQPGTPPGSIFTATQFVILIAQRELANNTEKLKVIFS